MDSSPIEEQHQETSSTQTTINTFSNEPNARLCFVEIAIKY